jgi:hypothetical protein
MRPDPGSVRVNRGTVRALVEEGKAYAVYVHGPSRAEVTIDLPAGPYRVEWIDTKSGQTARSEVLQQAKGSVKLASPPFVEDIALRVTRVPAK